MSYLIDYLYRVYNKSLTIPNILKRCRLDSVLRHLVIIISRLCLPIYFQTTQGNSKYRLNKNQPLIDGRNIIVSLTSFPARIEQVWLVVESILRQQIKPHRIILWLSKEQFSSIDILPQRLLSLQSRGLEIRMVDGDIRSHKKYVYAFKEYPNEYIILIDDDIIYPSNFISELLCGMDMEDRVNCSYGALINYDNKGNMMPYVTWQSITQDKTDDYRFFFGSGGGTIFIPRFLYKDCCNIELSQKLCPLADDIWLNAMCRIAHLKCCKVRTGLIFTIAKNSDAALYHENIGRNKNDIQLKDITSYYINELGVDIFNIKK